MTLLRFAQSVKAILFSLFSVVYGVLISPYPYAKPGEIWTPGLRSATANQQMRPYRLREYQEMSGLSSFADVMATGPDNVLLTGEFAPESLRGVRLTGNAFNFLAVPPRPKDRNFHAPLQHGVV